MIEHNLILGFVAGLFTVLGGVWTAYRLLGHAVYRELDQQGERISNLETRVDTQNKDVNSRLDRQTDQRHQSEKEAQDGRANLSARILLVEKEVRRVASKGQDE